MTATTQWLARSAQLTPETDGWLSDAELGYAQRLRFTKRRSEFRIARFTAKTALARALGLAEDDDGALRRIEVRHEPSGAPFPALDGRRVPWQVSLTDRADWAVCLLGEGPARIGCDLELVEPRSAQFVADYFTPAERGQLQALDGEQRALAANLIWSGKESALKVLTTGLRRDTRSVEVHAELDGAGWQPLRITTMEGAGYAGWWCRYGEFVLTVAGSDAAPRSLDPRPLLDGARPSHGWLGRPLTGLG